MVESTFRVSAAMKNAQWEIAKGHLRAFAALEGSHTSIDRTQGERYEEIHGAVEQFIADFERDFRHG